MFDLGSHVFVDEGKSKGYVIAAAAAQPFGLTTVRAAMRRLLLPGQDRLHFAKEGGPRRRSLLSAMIELDVTVVLYASQTKSDKLGRQRCLHALLDDVIKHQAHRLVLEQDDSLMRHDRQLIAARLREDGTTTPPDYLHLRSKSEPLIWISDAAAWCWQRGGEWRRRARQLIDQVNEV